MHCPYCGEENRESNRYCVGCGSALSGGGVGSGSPTSSRHGINRLVGTTRRARVVTAATAIAVVVAVGAFVALKPSESVPTADAFTRNLDRTCTFEKRTIGALERQTAQQQPPDVSSFAGALVLIVEEWRLSLRESPAPPSHAPAVEALDQALLDVLIQAGALGRVARNGGPAQVATKAQLVDNASARVDRAIDDLGLASCSNLDIGPVGIGRP
jgi:hypothetical protein